MSNARHDRSVDGGFSLLELVVVIAIMSGAVALLMPRFGSGPPRTAVQSMALQVAADLREARSAAMRTNTEQSFTLELGKRTSWSLARPVPRRFVDGIDVEVTGPGLEWAEDRAVRFWFQPNGAATGGQIAVRDRVTSALVRIDWLTGVARIERVR
jgi:general secretion pathway protein H